ncbi:hypothetical protein THF1C08_10038 [Vibrio jasicida]|uniref:Uridine kinase n=1 Tax=Vibrio jasicida TaxID=766224 RepID=A0AAU9QCR8_9VIBR|nr:hypothetical protein THF1C08_10038 [Vibrio jasicida]CAH1562175.1 hypothetical protein THF1A12_10038 [Vibrio jasicida]
MPQHNELLAMLRHVVFVQQNLIIASIGSAAGSGKTQFNLEFITFKYMRNLCQTQ